MIPRIKNWLRVSVLFVVVIIASNGNALKAAVIGIDAVHGFSAPTYLGTGSSFTTFRSVITGMGNTIVPLTSFEAADLAGLDVVFLKQTFEQNMHPYTASEIAAVTAFANQKAVFTSDSSIWSDQHDPNDPGIQTADNQLLLQNVLGYTASGHAAVFLADVGNGADAPNFNALVASYGIHYVIEEPSFVGPITGFVPHPITAGISQIVVAGERPMDTINPPSLEPVSKRRS